MQTNKGCLALLLPLSVLYRWGVELRNLLFDLNILKQKSYPIPIICIGNITVGGTGKTPHVEYILELLTPHLRVGIVSRGYKRKTKGLVLANDQSTASDLGDEPKQIQLKFPNVRIAVDGDRRRAIEALLALPKDERPEVILMDDGFQHRYVKPSHSIVLMDVSRIPMEDKMLPLGRLREPVEALRRATTFVLTKCNPEMQPIEYSLLHRQLNPYAYQKVFFSTIRYGEPIQVQALQSGAIPQPDLLPNGVRIIALSGIANPAPFEEELGRRYHLVHRLTYDDHHQFTPAELQSIVETYQLLKQESPNEPLYIICTEKDAVRLVDFIDVLPIELRESLYYLPIRIGILNNPDQFDKMIRKVSKRKKTL